MPSRRKTLNLCWFNVVPPSTTLDQRQTNSDSTSCDCWVVCGATLSLPYRATMAYVQQQSTHTGGGPRVVASTAAFHAKSSGFEFRRTVLSHSSHHPQEVLLAELSLYVHKGGLKPNLFHLHHPRLELETSAMIGQQFMNLTIIKIINFIIKF